MLASLPLELDALGGLDDLGGLDLGGLDHDGLDHLVVLAPLQQLPYTPENNSIHTTVLVNILHLTYT